MANTPGESKKNVRAAVRSYLNRDFDSFREAFIRFGRTFHKDVMQDYSENSFGGLITDLAAFVGDTQAFYLDHMFHETDINTAKEFESIERLLKKSKVPIIGAAPSVVEQEFIFKVPAATSNGLVVPDITSIPIVRSVGTIVSSQSGISFELTEDIDFTEKDGDGNLKASIKIGETDNQGKPKNFILSKNGICISGKRATETFQMGDFKPFFKFTIGNSNISEILSIIDDSGNEYYEVNNLAEDTVFRAIPNLNYDNVIVKDVLIPHSALYRFTKETSLGTRQTTITFGGGDSTNSSVTTLVDPATLAIPLYGKKVFNRIAINPNTLINTKSLGIASPNSTYTINYRYGGGLNHNVLKETIRAIQSLNLEFPNNPSTTNAQMVRSSADTINRYAASGGDDAPSIDTLKRLAPYFESAQNRVVVKEDLIARVYTLPSNFGRVYRASIHSIDSNPLASALYILTRDLDGKLVLSSDTLKKNLKNYLKTFRLTTDSIDILDGKILNIGLTFKISVDPDENRNLVVLQAVNKLISFFNVKKFEIDQPLVIDDIRNILYNTPGVMSVVDLQTNIPTDTEVRTYSNISFDIRSSTKNNILFPPKGGIFEVRYPTVDIVGMAV